MDNTNKWTLLIADDYGKGKSVDFHLFNEEEMTEYIERKGENPNPYYFYGFCEMETVVGEFAECLYGLDEDLNGCDITILKNEEEIGEFSIEDGEIIGCDCSDDDVITVEDGQIISDSDSELTVKEYRVNESIPYGAVLMQNENGEWFFEVELPEDEKLDLGTLRLVLTTNKFINDFNHGDDFERTFVTGIIINGQKSDLQYDFSSDDNRHLTWYKKRQLIERNME